MLAAIVLVLATAGGIAIHMLGARRASPPPVTVAAPLATATAAAPTSRPSAAPHAAPHAGTDPIVAVRAQADAIRLRARLPEGLTALAPGAPDPLAEDVSALPPPTLGHHTGDRALFAYAAAFKIEAPEAVTIHAFALDGDAYVAPERITGTLTAVDSKETLASLVFHDDGQNGDADAGDLLYTASATLGAERRVAGQHHTELVAVFADGEKRTTVCNYFYFVPFARPTGTATDRIDGGQLVIDLEVEASEPAHGVDLQASLHTADGEPFGLLEKTVDLTAGRQRIPLSFWGTLFHDLGVPGPYVLAHVLLRAPALRGSEQRTAVGYRTAAYPLTAFDAAPANNQRQLDFAQMLDAYAARLAEKTPARP
jgi:hypothetical protein